MHSTFTDKEKDQKQNTNVGLILMCFEKCHRMGKMKKNEEIYDAISLGFYAEI